MEIGLLWLGTLLGILMRWVVSTFPYSVPIASIMFFLFLLIRYSRLCQEYRQGKSPMFGDYEAQRHWMEITVNLPVQEWYRNSTNNNLLYWGLDYPPLTAYHSYLCGLVADSFNHSWIALGTSRGRESYQHKLFMRCTVLVADLLIFIPAVISYFRYSTLKERIKACAAIATFLYPGLILIDHGHFQYNCISLGLFVWAVALFERNQDILGSVAFTLALNYKQMELYHSLPIFCYLLGRCFHPKFTTQRILKFVTLGLAVGATFVVCWLPFLTNAEVATQVLRRIFPFDRGLYEDKVANLWCSLSVLVKLKQLFSVETLARFSAATTILLIIPSSVNVFRRPSLTRFKLALVNSALIFFLCSFQVHEKSILLAAIPVCLIFPSYPFTCLWFLLISVFSMWPLLLKDRLVIPFYASTTIYTVIVWRAFIREHLNQQYRTKTYVKIAFFCSIIGCIVLSMANILISPPTTYPDFFSLVAAVYSFIHLVLFAIYFHWLQFNCIDDHFARYVPVKLKDK